MGLCILADFIMHSRWTHVEAETEVRELDRRFALPLPYIIYYPINLIPHVRKMGKFSATSGNCRIYKS